jgi:type II secretory pathway component PulK
MITVLWVMAIATTVALAGSLAGRTTVSAARNRVQAERALWSAIGCARTAQAEIDAMLGSAPTLDEDALIWRTLEQRVVARQPSPRWPCDVRLEAAGAKLDVNSATPDMIAALLRAMGETDAHASEMAAALSDWRDTDEVESPVGAERSWYASAMRTLPRNGPLADIRELALVRGFENPRFEQGFTTETGRVSLVHASAIVLSAVPGFTRETADLIASLAEAGHPVTDASAVTGRLTSESAAELMAHYPEIVKTTTGDPDAWFLEVRAWNGEPRTTVILRWRLVRTGRRCSVVSSRTVL